MTTSVQSPVPERLLAALREAHEKTNEFWLTSLGGRKRAELEFHDRERDAHGVPESSPGTWEVPTANKKYYSTTTLSRVYESDWIRRQAPGRVVLDYACGNGGRSIEAAQAGAALVVGIDISSVSVENCRRRAATAGVSANTCFVQADCENTGLPNDSFDVVLCSGMLHHLDLSYAFPELRRIMKPWGTCLATEPLNYNPLIRLYRWLTPGMRTDWEKRHILSLKDVRFARRFFDVRSIRYWHLFSIGAAPLRNTPLFAPALKVANVLDSVALRVPGISLMAWMFTFELVRKQDA